MRVAEKRDLYRRGAHGEHPQPMAGRVPGKIDQDVDTIGHDGLAQRGIVEQRGLQPAIGAGSGPAGVAVVHAARVVDADLEPCVVQARQQRLHEDVHRMLAVQVCGDEADTQPALGLARVGEFGVPPKGRLDRRAQAPMPVGHLLGRQSVVVEGSHRDAGGQPRERVAGRRIGRLQAAQVAFGVAMAPTQASFEQARIAVTRRQGLQPPQALAAIRQQVSLGLDRRQGQPGGHEIRPDGHGLLQNRNRFLPVVERMDFLRQQKQEFGAAGQRCPREGHLRGSGLADTQHGLAEVHHRAAAHGAPIEQAGQGVDRGLRIAGVQPPDPHPMP